MKRTSLVIVLLFLAGLLTAQTIQNKPTITPNIPDINEVWTFDVLSSSLPHFEIQKNQTLGDSVQSAIETFNKGYPDKKKYLGVLIATDLDKISPTGASGKFQNIPLGKALQIIAGMYDCGIRISDGNAIIISDLTKLSPAKSVRTYMPSLKLKKALKLIDGKSPIDMTSWFRSQGIEMPNRAEAYYYPTGTILMRNYSEEVVLMESVLVLEDRRVNALKE
jgi:hypothetical protein